jgi:hypothetical protein
VPDKKKAKPKRRSRSKTPPKHKKRVAKFEEKIEQEP